MNIDNVIKKEIEENDSLRDELKKLFHKVGIRQLELSIMLTHKGVITCLAKGNSGQMKTDLN
jgi:hypothetical protein